eukprot:1195816-Prorocentrum_minimum.AAC.9
MQVQVREVFHPHLLNERRVVVGASCPQGGEELGSYRTALVTKRSRERCKAHLATGETGAGAGSVCDSNFVARVPHYTTVSRGVHGHHMFSNHCPLAFTLAPAFDPIVDIPGLQTHKARKVRHKHCCSTIPSIMHMHDTMFHCYLST